jgi:hypothetical protein
MKLLTEAQAAQLAENGRRQAPVKGTAAEIDFVPVVKLFDPCGAGTWLFTETEPDDPDIAWGLCDLGCLEFGTVSLNELRAIRGPLGLGIERDLYFEAEKPISAYCEEAFRLNRIKA